MKKIIFVIVGLLFVQLSFSQNEDDKIREMIKIFEPVPRSGVIKGFENLYAVDTISVLCTVANKKVSKLKPNVDNTDPSYKVTFVSPDILNSILKKNLSTCIDFEKMNGNESFYLIFEVDLSGKVNTVCFMYLCSLNIPITIIEQIETDIRNQCRFDFSRNSPAFIHANYLSYTHTVYLKEACF